MSMILGKLSAGLVMLLFPFMLFCWGVAVLAYAAMAWASQTLKATPDA